MNPVLQSEATECGLASLAMVAQHHGHKIDLNAMRQRFGSSLMGARLRDLMKIAEQLSLGSRALRLEPESLKDIALPAILHWDMDHFVVLKEVRRNRFVVFDPARGRVSHSLAGISNHFTGVALELTPAADFEPIVARARTRLSSLWSRLSGLKRSLTQILILSVAIQLFALASPFYLQLAIDEAVIRFDTDLLFLLGIGFGGLYLIQAMTEALRSWVILLLGQSMTLQMAGNVLRHLIRLPADFFEKRHAGDIISRIGSIQPIQMALTQSMVSALIDGVMVIATVVMMLLYNWKLAVIAIAFTVAYLTVSLVLFPFMRGRQEELIAKRAAENTHIIETIRASRAIKLFGREAERENAWRNLYTDVINAGISYGRLEIGNRFASSLSFGLQTVFVIYFGAQFILTGEMSIGMLFAFMSYRQNFAATAEGLVNKGIEFRMLGLHLERLADIVQSAKEEGLEAPLSEIRQVRGSIDLEEIGFRYEPNAPLLFEDVSLSIRPGEFIAIAGPSGGGKTTLLKVMLGLLKPESGIVRVDGLPLHSVGLRNWRAAVGVVMQDDQLLSGSIADNIASFDPRIDMERVIECATLAQAHEDISQMPMHYLSMIGDMGAALSGGQRQRLLLARALYHDPQVLFLDEGTANLDLESERRIGQAISDMKITRIVVAHRPELLGRADRVFTMAGGKLVEKVAPQPPGS